MTVLQSNSAPITTDTSLQIVTLKNIVALDLVESNEAVLKAFGLFDDSNKKVNLKTLSKSEIQEKINELKSNEPIDLKQYKNNLNNKDNSKQLLDALASEFLTDEIPIDNTDDLIKQFEIENKVRIVIDDTPGIYYEVKAKNLKQHTETEDVEMN